jgi:LPS-assembly protein
MAPVAVTSELPALFGEQNLTTPGQEVILKAQQQEKQGDIYKLDGDVEIAYQGYVLRADHATYNNETGDSEATGRVVLDGGPHDAHLTANRATYNVKSGTGIFYEVAGTFGAVIRGQSVILTSNNPFVIAGREVHKVGPNRFIVYHGSITSCAEQTPRWTFNSQKIDLVAGEDAKLYHASFRLLKLPIFYFPYTKAPANNASRTTGFLLPVLSPYSTTKGLSIGDSFYWAINRSNDVTGGIEYFSRRGWSQRLNFRTRPSEQSSLELRYFGVLDRGTMVTQNQDGNIVHVKQDQGGEDARLIGETTHGEWRAAADIDYLSSFLFRQAWSETYSQAANSEVRSVAYLSRNEDGFSLNVDAARYQNFYQDPQTNSYSNQIKIIHAPMGEINGLERRLFDTSIVWGVDSSLGGLQRSEPGVVTEGSNGQQIVGPGFATANLVGRIDLRPRMAMPLQFAGWNLRPEVALHETLYTQEVTQAAGHPLGVGTGDEINRRDVEASVELRPPAMEKTFNRELFGRRLRHVIEPILTYRYTNGINNFQNVIRFDQVDILSNTSEFEYDLIQRIYGRPRSNGRTAGCEQEAAAAEAQRKAGTQAQTPGPGHQRSPVPYIPGMSAVRPKCEEPSETPRELLSWEVKQKYYINERFGGALVTGRRNVLTDTADLTGIAFLDGARTWSPVISKLRVQTSLNTDVQWQLDYDPVRGRINSSATFAEYRIGEYFVGLSHAFFREIANPATETVSCIQTGAETACSNPLVFNQLRALIGYGHPNKRGFSGGFSAGYDQNRNFLQYAAVQSSYNWDCCGISFEFRHINIPGVNVENVPRIAFTLSNIGTFGNMRRQERLY